MSENLIYMILYGFGMLIVTLIIQFVLYKTKKNIDFWSGTEPVIILCILGLLTNEVGDIAGILGYAIADRIGKFAGWHNTKTKKDNQ